MGEIYRNRSEYVNLRRDYVEGLTIPMSALVDFDSIDYAWSIKSGEEYVRISDIIEGTTYLNVTDKSRAEILKDVARCILMDETDLAGIVPETIIRDKNKIREISKLFK